MAKFETYVGKCIYCGSTNPPLTREHVVPRGLGGFISPDGSHEALVLQKASCEICRQKTRAFEDKCLNSMFPHIRNRLGFRRKDRPVDKVLATTRESEGGREELLDPHTLHAPFPVPRFDRAEVLHNEKSDDADIVFLFPKEFAGTDRSANWGLNLTVDVSAYAQLIAKIALGVTVAGRGIDGFVPMVHEIVTTKPNEYRKWIGGINEEDPAPSEKLHEVNLRTMRAPHGDFIVVYVRLFAEFGAPTNYVVVGKPL